MDLSKAFNKNIRENQTRKRTVFDLTTGDFMYMKGPATKTLLSKIGKNFPECTTIDGGTFEFCLKRRRWLWFFKEGYQVQKMRIKKKNALGLRVVLKQEECDTGNGEAFL